VRLCFDCGIAPVHKRGMCLHCFERDNKTCFDAEGREFSSEQAARDYFAGNIVICVEEVMYGV